MKVFVDVFSGDELCSDSYKIEKIFGAAGMKIRAKYIVVGGESFDIGAGNAFGGAEEEEKVNFKYI
jgi:hypothetical protein